MRTRRISKETNLEKPIAETKHTKATTFTAMKAVPGKDGSEVGGSFGSETSYEATVVGEGAEHKLSVPQHPTMAFDGIPFKYGEPFQCRYCYTEQTVKNRGEWKYAAFQAPSLTTPVRSLSFPFSISLPFHIFTRRQEACLW
jgi:hypothetical protein